MQPNIFSKLNHDVIPMSILTTTMTIVIGILIFTIPTLETYGDNILIDTALMVIGWGYFLFGLVLSIINWGYVIITIQDDRRDRK